MVLGAALAAALIRTGWAASDDVGTTVGQFLKMPVGARAVAMGSAYSAVAQDATAVYWNPAALAKIENRSVSLMHASLFESVTLDFLGYGQSFKGLGSFGFGIQYLSAGSIDKTDSSGFTTGDSFRPNDTALSLAYAGKISGFSAGISAKYIRSRLAGSASAFAADIGFLSPGCMDGRLVFALAAQNLGGKLKFDQASESLPRNVRAGSALALAGGWVFALDLNLPKDNRIFAGAGGEKRFDFRNFNAAVRAGYNTQTSGDIDGFTGFSTGLGINLKKIRVDYALLLFGKLGSTHRLSLTADF